MILPTWPRYYLGQATRALARWRTGPARSVAAVSIRTRDKDSFAAPKTLPFNDFSHFAQCAQLRDLAAGPRCGSTSLRRPSVRALAKTRMNTRFSPADDGPKRAVTIILTRVRLS
jgi:hypothetical protein